MHRRDVALSAHRDIRRAPLKGDRAVRGRARTFGEDDQIAATANCCNAVFNQLDAVIIIANIGRGTNRGMGERVAPKLALDDAVGPLDKGHEKHNIDERRMIGKNQQPVALQSFQSANFILEHTHHAHQAKDTAESKPDYAASDG